MAYTIESTNPTIWTADSLHSPYRPLKVRVTSSGVADIKKMKCFINIDDAATDDNADTPILLDPDYGTTNEFTFDLSSYLQGLDTLTSNQQAVGSTVDWVDSTSNSLKKIKVRFKEVYLDSNGLLVDEVYSPHPYSDSFYIVNGVWQHDEVSSKFDSFEIASSGDKYFLTNYRTNILQRNFRTIGLNDSEYVSGFTNLTAIPYYRLILYTSKYNQGTPSSYYQPLSAFNTERFDLPVGIANIHATSGGWLNSSGASVSDPVIDSSVGSYSVALTTGTNNTKTSEVVHFNVDHQACTDDHTRIKFLNRLGAFEYFTFKGYKDRSLSIRRNYFNTALDADYTLDKGGDRALYIDSRTEFTVYSQPLKEYERIWLEEMLEGMECFVLEGTNYIPIKVRAGKTQIIQEGNDLFTIKMTYQYANPNRRQHG
jgi:hypothetical protein